MKSTNLLFIIVALVLFSCTDQSKAPMTQEEKNELTTEVNAVINSMEEGMKNLDVSQTFENFLFNEDFKYIYINGKVLNSEAFLDQVSGVFDVVKKVEWGFSDVDIRIVTPDVAVVTLIYHGTYYFPKFTLASTMCGSTLVLEKTAEGWKVIHFQESLQESDHVITES